MCFKFSCGLHATKGPSISGRPGGIKPKGSARPGSGSSACKRARADQLYGDLLRWPPPPLSQIKGTQMRRRRCGRYLKKSLASPRYLVAIFRPPGRSSHDLSLMQICEAGSSSAGVMSAPLGSRSSQLGELGGVLSWRTARMCCQAVCADRVRLTKPMIKRRIKAPRRAATMFPPVDSV